MDAGEKERLVREVFSSVASKYDVMNDLMSFGVHRVWKDEFVNMIGFGAAAKIDPNYVPRHLDVAGGTGDIAFRSVSMMGKVFRPAIQAKLSTMEYDNPANRPVVVCDINPEMLAVGKSRAVAQVGADNAKLVCFCMDTMSSFVLNDFGISDRWTLWKETQRSCPFPMNRSTCTLSPLA